MCSLEYLFFTFIVFIVEINQSKNQVGGNPINILDLHGLCKMTKLHVCGVARFRFHHMAYER